jgi:hypothetical protein
VRSKRLFQDGPLRRNMEAKISGCTQMNDEQVGVRRLS